MFEGRMMLTICRVSFSCSKLLTKQFSSNFTRSSRYFIDKHSYSRLFLCFFVHVYQPPKVISIMSFAGIILPPKSWEWFYVTMLHLRFIVTQVDSDMEIDPSSGNPAENCGEFN